MVSEATHDNRKPKVSRKTILAVGSVPNNGKPPSTEALRAAATYRSIHQRAPLISTPVPREVSGF